VLISTKILVQHPQLKLFRKSYSLGFRIRPLFGVHDIDMITRSTGIISPMDGKG